VRLRQTIAAATLSLVLGGCHTSTQRADLSFEPSIPQPAYLEDMGPVVQIDEAHFNFHTVDGRNASETIDSVRTFTGQAFRAERDVEPLLTIPSGSTLRLPIKAWKFKPTSPSVPAGGMLQGAVFRFGKGRVAVFGEAAMFSAQERISKDGRTLMGMNRPDATQNPQFLLNVMHWLSGSIE
jgi:hypothetical protein